MTMKLFKPRQLNNRGDTIVEVLIVLAVLSMAFGISYATANGSLSRSRNAEEHTEAQGILSSQAELLRAAVSNGVTLPTSMPFCMKANGQVASSAGWTAVPADVNSDNLSTTSATPAGPYPTECNPRSSYYYASIVYVPPTAGSRAYYDLRVRWQGINQLGGQQVEYTYAIAGNSTAVVGGGNGYINCPNCTTPPPPPPPTPAAPNIISFTANGHTGNTKTVYTVQSLTLAWKVTPVGPGVASVNCSLSGSGSGTFSYTAPGASSDTSNRDADVKYYADNLIGYYTGQPLSYQLTCNSIGNDGINSTPAYSSTINVYVEQPFFRLYSPGATDHFYTANVGEKRSASSGGYSYDEGVAGYIDYVDAPAIGDAPIEVPLYRLYSPSLIDHFYTTSASDIAVAEAFFGYYLEGVAGYVEPFTGSCPYAATTPLYRLYSWSITDHLYTTDWNEWNQAYDLIGNIGPYPNQEGIQACVYNAAY